MGLIGEYTLDRMQLFPDHPAHQVRAANPPTDMFFGGVGNQRIIHANMLNLDQMAF